ncbi:MAG: hypothetical protein R3290_13595, partial [Acidimicrobiia bacterium]|nr:hypothetical protein [Acidimicrobiia bacterium]
MSARPSAVRSLVAWWEPRRLHLRGLPRVHRTMSIVAIVVAVGSGVLAVAIGEGWTPPGGLQVTAFGGTVPRLLVPWSLVVLGALGFVAVASATDSVWRFPWLARASVALLGAALAAQTVAFGWVADMDDSIGMELLRLLGWAGLGAAIGVLLVPQRVVDRRPFAVAWWAVAPFGLSAFVWAVASGEATVTVPGLVLSPRDVFAQATVTVVGALVAAVGILVLWSIVLSSRQARDMGDGLSALADRAGPVVAVAAGAKLLWLGLGYGRVGSFGGGAFETSRGDGAWAWLIGAVLVLGAGAWLIRRRAAPGVEQGRIVVRWVGLGFAAVYVAAVLMGLLVAVLAVLPPSAFAERLIDAVDWLTGADSRVPFWGVVVTSIGALVVLPVLRSRRIPAGYRWAAVVLAVWMAPRAIELAVLLRDDVPGFDAPSLATVDALLSVLVAVLAVGRMTGRIEVPARTLLLVLGVSTLLAHPFRLLPMEWRSGWLFYLLLAYPLLYRFGFNAKHLNEAAPDERPGVVVRTVVYITVLV